MKRETGIYEVLGNLKYFIPHPLPPTNPSLDLSSNLANLYGETMQQLGKLNEMAKRLPSINRFLKAYIIKEALLSSEIEGVHTTLIEVFTTPIADSKPNKQIQLVLNYTKALDQTIAMIQEQGLSISTRVIRSVHETLMTEGQGDKANPGNYRQQAVRVGELIPPQAQKIAPLMADLEKFINTDTSIPPLIKAGLAHVQFETIHPFLDGNGRIGRLLIVLMLVKSGLLNSPILYPSYYFKKYRFDYYKKLDSVRLYGDFEGWTEYYLNAINISSQDAYKRAQEIEVLEKQLQEKINENTSTVKKQELGAQALSVIFNQPVISIPELAAKLEKSYNSASSIITLFVDMDILTEKGEQKRNKLYQFDSYLKLLDKEYNE